MCHQFIIQLFSHLYIFSLYKIMFFFCSCYNGLCFRLKDGSRAMAVPKKIAHPYWTVFASARTLQDNWPSRGLFRHRRFQFTDSFDLWWIRQKSLWRYDVSKIGQFCDHDFSLKQIPLLRALARTALWHWYSSALELPKTKMLSSMITTPLRSSKYLSIFFKNSSWEDFSANGRRRNR